MIKENQKRLNLILMLLDINVVAISIFCAYFIKFNTKLLGQSFNSLSLKGYIVPVLLMEPIYLYVYYLLNLYTPHRYKTFFEEFKKIVYANILSILILIVLLFLFRVIDYSRTLLALFFIVNIILMTLERGILRNTLRSMRKKGYNQKHVLLVGISHSSFKLIRLFNENPQWGYKVEKVLRCSKVFSEPDEAYKEAAAASLYENNDYIEDLEDLLNKKKIDEVFITLGIKEFDKLPNVIGICEKCGVRTEIIPDYYRYIPAKPYVEEVGGLPFINIRYIPLDDTINKIVKRGFDIIVAAAALVIFSPVMLITAIAIKLSSKGPVIFRQERIGLNKNTFVMYKFRSMKLQSEVQEKREWTNKEDDRRTKVGAFIRKTSIDELPQLFNVLKGDMSIIGPRPERPYFVEKFREEIPKYMIKHQVRPGMTGWAQVNGLRGDTSIEERIKYDVYYIENWSFIFDLKIIFLTIIKGFINQNAY